MQFRLRTTLAGCVAGMLLTAFNVAEAANWLMLQGTEPPQAAPTTKLWGFIQPQYAETDGTKLTAGTPFGGQDAVFNQITPDLTSNDQFQIARARIGVRGQNFPLNSNINYFMLAEFGNNGITKPDGGSVKLTDASVTLNYIPGARIRFGQFKYPGAEEGLQAIHVFNYVYFTNVTDQLLLERFFDRDGQPACTVAGLGTSSTCANAPNGSVGAFRDIGVQVFDAFRFGDWEHSYAVMIGNGNGIDRGDNNDDKDTYVYWSSEWIFGGEGVWREGLKLFAWNQDGKRTIVTGGTVTQANGTTGTFDRKRSGAGVTFRKDRYRAAAEYITADGMIFDGTDGGALPGALNNAGTVYSTFNMATEDKADGYYVDFGYRVLPDLELDLRYDTLNRRTDSAPGNERQFTTTTVGMQYFFDKKNRIAVNYEFRDAEAPNLPSSDVANQVLDSLDDRISVQFTAIF